MQARLTFTAGTGWDKSGHAIAELPVAIMTIRAMLAQAFGGYTETATMGGWIDGNGKLVQEPGRQWTVLAEGEYSQLSATAKRIAEDIASALNQYSVMLEIEQNSYSFVSQPVTIKAPANKELQP